MLLKDEVLFALRASDDFDPDPQDSNGNILVLKGATQERIGWISMSTHGFISVNLNAESDKTYKALLLELMAKVVDNL